MFNIQQLFEFFIERELNYSNQSCLKPGDSCINQLLFITHEIHEPLVRKNVKSEMFSLICQYPANICCSSRRLEDVFKTCPEDDFNTTPA